MLPLGQRRRQELQNTLQLTARTTQYHRDSHKRATARVAERGCWHGRSVNPEARSAELVGEFHSQERQRELGDNQTRT